MCRWSFKLYDIDNSGTIALEEMEKVREPQHGAQVMVCNYNMLEGTGKRPSGCPKEMAKQIFEKIDVNGNFSFI